jgi:phosphatidylinositol alpha-1,6-mannosyltransferase
VNDVVTYLGDYCRGRIAAAFSPAAAARMHCLVPGVDAEVFRPGAGGTRVRERLGLAGRPVVVCVARFVARKGQDVLVRALPAIRAKVPDAALLLVGDGPHHAAVAKLVDGLGLRAHVRMTGQVAWAETAAYYDAGDIFCMPTRTRRWGLEPEALGICYLEAAASGLPVVVGDSGGAPDTVREGRTGFVVNGRDIDTVADRCARLLLDHDLAGRLGGEGRAWVQRRWNWPGQVALLEQLLEGQSSSTSH